MTTFLDLGLTERQVEILTASGLTTPTPIQTRAIPLVLEGRDVMGLAQTGTGKTAAFGLPLIQQIKATGKAASPKGVLALILAPTRELAKQIVEALKGFTGPGHFKINMVVGGVSINPQITRLSRGSDILVATPGRLIDLLDRRAVNLSEARWLVLDEADQMLDMGFIHALRRIAPLLPSPRQTMLFSATMPSQMTELAKTYLNDPVRIEVARPGVPADKIAQSVVFATKDEKPMLLRDELRSHPDELALVFARTKHGAERLMKKLVSDGFNASSIHGNKSQGQRDRALDAFRAGTLKILVATDVAARGIDIPEVRHVYNLDLPNVPENYVHRIGRTARAGAAGRAVSYCAPDEMSELRQIEKVLGNKLPVAGGAPWGPPGDAKPARSGRGGGGGGKPATGKPAQGARRRRPRRSGGGARKAA